MITKKQLQQENEELKLRLKWIDQDMVNLFNYVHAIMEHLGLERDYGVVENPVKLVPKADIKEPANLAKTVGSK